MRTLAVMLTLGCLLSPVDAQENKKDADKQAAKDLFNRATTHFNLGRFKEAAREYEQLYEGHPDPSLLYNIAQSHRLGGELDRGLFFYKSYLRTYPRAPNREEVSRRIADLERALEQQKRPPNEAIIGPAVAPEPAPVATPPPAVKADVTVSSSAPVGRERTPVYKKWWLWTVVGVAVVGVAVGVGVGVGVSSGTSYPTSPSTTGGTFQF